MLLPAALLPIPRAVWRATFGAAGVLLAAVAAGLSGATLPLSSRGPAPLGAEGSEATGAVATGLLDSLTATPELLLAAAAVAMLAALLPPAAGRGIWPVVGLGAAATAILLLPVEAVRPLPVIAGIWLCCVGVSVRAEVLRR
jgi:hypothetical protein